MLRGPGGGTLAVLPAARASNAKVYYEPAPPREFAPTIPLPPRTRPLADSRGSTDTLLGYFVAGLMEHSLVDRMTIGEQTWKSILHNAVIVRKYAPNVFSDS